MEGEDRRERLARLNLERMTQQPEQGWAALGKRASDIWERFFAFSGLEKGFYFAGLALVVILGITALVVLITNSGSDTNGGHQPSASLPGRPTAVSQTAVPTATALVIGVLTMPTTVPADRQDCEAIRGTDYRSDAERAWFNANCTTPTPTPPPAVRPGPGHTGDGGPSQPTPTPPTGPSSGEATALAAAWITNSAPVHYTAADSCTAIGSGNHWVVSCNATPPGCDSTGCDITVSVCVFSSPTRVVPSAQC